MTQPHADQDLVTDRELDHLPEGELDARVAQIVGLIKARGRQRRSGEPAGRWQEDIIAREIPAGARVLDLGCGDGFLLERLMRERGVRGQGVEIDRDVVFVAVADEEEGGHKGVHHLRRTRPDLLQADFVFNEGAYGFSQFLGKKVTMFGLGPSEKSPCWLKLVARGRPGHGSVPHGDNALARLVRALARVEAREHRARLTAPVELSLSSTPVTSLPLGSNAM